MRLKIVSPKNGHQMAIENLKDYDNNPNGFTGARKGHPQIRWLKKRVSSKNDPQNLWSQNRVNQFSTIFVVGSMFLTQQLNSEI